VYTKNMQMISKSPALTEHAS